MAKVDDVAARVLDDLGALDTYKLQKLIYYCQAWHLVWERRPLFTARIEAWANGPVVPKLYKQHRGRYKVKNWPTGDTGRLAPEELTTVEAVVDYYGEMSGLELAQLTHREAPWKEVRAQAGLGPGDRGDVEIPLSTMLEYYEGLVP